MINAKNFIFIFTILIHPMANASLFNGFLSSSIFNTPFSMIRSAFMTHIATIEDFKKPIIYTGSIIATVSIFTFLTHKYMTKNIILQHQEDMKELQKHVKTLAEDIVESREIIAGITSSLIVLQLYQQKQEELRSAQVDK